MFYPWSRYNRTSNVYPRDYARWKSLKQRGVKPDYTITYLSVYRRDRGICGICKYPVSWRYCEVDHVIPVSKGGKDEWPNVQIAHPQCNASKGDSILDPTLYPSNVKKE